MTIYKNNTTLVWVNGLKNSLTGGYVSDATGSGLLHDAAGNVVANSAFTMSYDTNSNGNYYGSLPPTLALVVGERYTARVTMVDSARNVAYFEIPAEIAVRES